jgi:HSP20 family protein
METKSGVPVKQSASPARQAFSPFTSLQREIDRLFDDFSSGFGGFGRAAPELVPSMDVAETDKEIELVAELPGLEDKDVEVSVSDGVLTIRGEKKAEKEEKQKNWHRVERSYGAFARSIQLPPGIDPNAIKASLAKGVLKVTVPKPASAAPRKIAVKADA